MKSTLSAENRREALRAALYAATAPVSASVLAARFSVSRQVIVGDIALLRAAGEDISASETLGKHAHWVDALKQRYSFTEENAMDIILQETGKVFAEVLEDAGVYKNTAEGKAAFLKFIDHVNA